MVSRDRYLRKFFDVGGSTTKRIGSGVGGIVKGVGKIAKGTGKSLVSAVGTGSSALAQETIQLTKKEEERFKNGQLEIFGLTFGGGLDYKCKAVIAGRKGDKLTVNCVAISEKVATYPCEAESKYKTGYGKVKLKGKECLLERFSLSKTITLDDEEFIPEEEEFAREGDFKFVDLETLVHKLDVVISDKIFEFEGL